MTRKHQTGAWLLVAVVVVAGTGACARMRHGAETPEKMVFAVASLPVSAPIYIALEKGFFAREGLQVELQSHVLGREALASVLRGGAHFAAVADTPLALAGLRNQSFFVVATITHSSKYAVICARKSRGIASAQDLRGKVIAISRGTTSHYYLHSYLNFYEVPEAAVQTVDINQDQMAAAFGRGEIDAAVTWSPFIEQQQKRLGGDSIVLGNEHIYRITWNIAAQQGFVKSHPATVEKLLRGLIQAQQYIAKNTQETEAITRKYVGQGIGTFRNLNFDVRLDRALLTSLEAQSRWAMEAGLTRRREVPNYLNLIYADGMEAVAPNSVALTYR